MLRSMGSSQSAITVRDDTRKVFGQAKIGDWTHDQMFLALMLSTSTDELMPFAIARRPRTSIRGAVSGIEYFADKLESNPKIRTTV